MTLVLQEDFGLGILVNDVPLGTTGMSVVVSCFDDVAGDRLTALSANNCRLGPAGVGLLGTAVIASCPNLQKLFVSSNIASAEDGSLSIFVLRGPFLACPCALCLRRGNVIRYACRPLSTPPPSFLPPPCFRFPVAVECRW